MTAKIYISDIEAAINFFRTQPPHDIAFNEEALNALAEVYALMIVKQQESISPEKLSAIAMDAWLQWVETMPDAPCIAICSTTQGDAICKGCGRTFQEVQEWTSMSPVEKRAVWHRITKENTAWRFNRYKERALAIERPHG